MKKPLVILLILGLAGLTAGCDQEKLDARKLADALSEELTGEMDFDNSTEVTGDPPAEHVGDESYPQVESFEAPLDITTGIPAQITLRLSPAYGDPSNIIGAVAHVVQANKDDAATRYFDIRPVPPIDLVTREMTLTANLVGPVDQFLGNAFHVRFAILRDLGTGAPEVGNYVDWNVIFEPPPDYATTVPNCCCHEEFNADGQLSSRNVFFVDFGACRAALPAVIERYLRKGDYLNQLSGGPCSIWRAAIHGLNTMASSGISRLYPSGTRFSPVEALDPQRPELRKACQLEILCMGEPQDSPGTSVAERLMTFNNGSVVNLAPPPEGQETDPFAEIPLEGIAPLSGSLEVGLGDLFGFTVNFYSNPVEAVGAIIVISQADGFDTPPSYIRIDQPADDGMPDYMTIYGRVTETTAAAGHAYRMRVAVISRTETGREGICNYADMYLFVRPRTDQTEPRRCLLETATIINHGPPPSSSGSSPMTPEELQMVLQSHFVEAFQYVMSAFSFVLSQEMPHGTRVYYPGYEYEEMGHYHYEPPSILELQCPESID
jgi:hypothetical protein